MHNNIMATGSRDRSPMLATGRYPQGRSRFLRYIDTRPNDDALRKCILDGCYIPTTVLVQAVAATDDSLAILEHTAMKYTRLLTLAKQLRKCGKLSKGYNKPEWSRFVTIVKQQHKLDEVSYHKLFDILKQYQKEVNELCAARLAMNASLLALVATALANQDPYYQTSKSQKSYAPSSKPSIPTRSPITTRYKGKPKRVKDSAYHKEKMLLCKQAEKGVPLQAEQYDWLADTDEEIDEHELEAHYSYMEKIQEVPTADTGTDFEPLEQNDQNDVESDDEHVALANLIANLKLNTEFEKYKAFNDRTIDYDKLERKLNETLGQLAQKDIEIKEGLKLKAYEILVVKEKHDELIKHSLLTKPHYEGLVKQKTKVIMDLKLKEEHDIYKMLSMEKQLKFLNKIVYKRSQSIQTIHMMAPKIPTYNGRPTFANPRYLKQAQFEIPCLYAFPYDQYTHPNRLIPDGEETLALERESRSKLNKDSYVESLEKEIDELKYDKAKFLNMYDMILKECVCNEVMCSYLLSLSDLDALAKLQSLYLNKVKECAVLHKSFRNKLNLCKEQVKNDTVWNEQASNVFQKEHKQYIKIQDLKAQLQDKNIAISELKKLIEKGKGKYVETKFDKSSVVQQPNAQRIPKPSVLGVNHKTNVSRPPHKSNQLKDKVVPNNSQLKLKKTQVEEHPRILSISNKIKSVTACNDSSNSKNSNANAVCATCEKCVVDSDHFACVTKMLNDVNDRTKKPKVVPISTRKPKGHTNKSVATPHKKKVASKSTTQKPKSYYRMLYEKTGKA
uniref:Gag-Pol polyprotein n=1 Tax=Tanacetum cinerariifolium TaxID=118510 RepID=A0A699IDR0_TANCI|nr:hypothetical protein [Tanacetum cinerariifolium]